MKKYLLMTLMLVMAIAVSAQTHNNPRQRSNNKHVKVTKVVRTKTSTVLTLQANYDKDMYCYLDGATLTDEVNGKRYNARKALNFQWKKKYQGRNFTFRIEFPAIPTSASVVTFRETGSSGNPFVINNIAIPVKQNKSTTPSTQKEGKTIIINM